MTAKNGETYVTYKQFAIWLTGTVLSATALLGTFISTGWSVHARQPHPGATTSREFNRLVERFQTHVTQVESRLIRLDDKLDTILLQTKDP